MRHLLKAVGTASAILGLLTAIHPAAAHHSRSMYDHTKILTIVGTIKEVRWVNPHVTLLVSGAAQEGAESNDWLLEMTSPSILVRLGWTRTSIKPGDHVQVELNPLLDEHEHGGAPRKVTLTDTAKSFGADYRGSEYIDNE